MKFATILALVCMVFCCLFGSLAFAGDAAQKDAAPQKAAVQKDAVQKDAAVCVTGACSAARVRWLAPLRLRVPVVVEAKLEEPVVVARPLWRPLWRPLRARAVVRGSCCN